MTPATLSEATEEVHMVEVKVGGAYACFSRPELKVERVSYPVMTPSAARGLLEAIFWKPEMDYRVREIWVLRPVRSFSLLRNELSDRQGEVPFFVEDRRQQRASLILKDVEYIVRAEVVLRPHSTKEAGAYVDQFRRRVARGQCFHTPYLGTREFAAWFEPPTGQEQPIQEDRDLGIMLLDVAYRQDPASRELEFRDHDAGGVRDTWGRAEAGFFHARMVGGIVRVPQAEYDRLRSKGGHDAA